MVNSRGQVVGMNTAVSNAQNIGFAIAIDTARPIADDLKHGNAGTTARAFLGVSTVTLTEDLRAELGIKASKGALVRGVQQGAPAENAGLQAGDVIIRVGDADIASSDDLGTAVRRHKAGDRIEIRWQRGSDQRSATVTLGSTTLSQ